VAATLTVTGAGRYSLDTLVADRSKAVAEGVRPLKRAA
jgi:hypothetical protein